jgi:hypothetical protein
VKNSRFSILSYGKNKGNKTFKISALSGRKSGRNSAADLSAAYIFIGPFLSFAAEEIGQLGTLHNVYLG